MSDPPGGDDPARADGTPTADPTETPGAGDTDGTDDGPAGDDPARATTTDTGRSGASGGTDPDPDLDSDTAVIVGEADRDAAAVADPDRGRGETFLVGVAMGAADAVPGVSGGTIALIAGVYDRLVAAIAAFEPALLWRGASERDPGPLLALLRGMDLAFLLTLGAGVAVGLATVARVVERGLAAYAAPTFAFFFGLIGASAVVLFDQVSLSTRRRQVVAVGGFALAFALVGEFRAALGHEPPVVFLAGMVSISAMILPGVSGSFLLLMFGQYEFMAGTLNDFVDALAALPSGGAVEPVLVPAAVVVTYCAGAAVGLLSFARVVEAALERDRATTLTFLVALMVGALRLPVREVLAAAPATATGWAGVGLAAAVGAALVVGLDRYTAGLGYETTDAR